MCRAIDFYEGFFVGKVRGCLQIEGPGLNVVNVEIFPWRYIPTFIRPALFFGVAVLILGLHLAFVNGAVVIYGYLYPASVILERMTACAARIAVDRFSYACLLHG